MYLPRLAGPDMSLSDLFPGPGTYLVSWLAPEVEGELQAIVGERAHLCARCGSLVADKQRHTRWHASVDTAATALLPADTKDPR